MSRFVLLILATALVSSACARNEARTPLGRDTAGVQAADTLRGIVRIVDAEPATSITLDAVAAGAVVLRGERRVLEQLSGIEVTVWGKRQSPDRFHVAHVAVRVVAGMAALDGMLQHNGDGYVLLTAIDQRLPLPYLPAELRSQLGARIWLAGPLDRPPDSYGVIR